ncbi:hypothetical protein PIB30_068759 [Stylosanthes scabra]|uniref:Secreted protein n=1 Tax=Stylosanthes scabra TaxID=79078 RepID=A0ABU6WLC2_9FABA|nr:hypothetical protein [Stylosanthes scabra]
MLSLLWVSMSSPLSSTLLRYHRRSKKLSLLVELTTAAAGGSAEQRSLATAKPWSPLHVESSRFWPPGTAPLSSESVAAAVTKFSASAAIACGYRSCCSIFLEFR